MKKFKQIKVSEELHQEIKANANGQSIHAYLRSLVEANKQKCECEDCERRYYQSLKN